MSVWMYSTRWPRWMWPLAYGRALVTRIRLMSGPRHSTAAKLGRARARSRAPRVPLRTPEAARRLHFGGEGRREPPLRNKARTPIGVLGDAARPGQGDAGAHVAHHFLDQPGVVLLALFRHLAHRRAPAVAPACLVRLGNPRVRLEGPANVEAQLPPLDA